MTPRKPSVEVYQWPKRIKPKPFRLGPMEFYRILDMMPVRWRPCFVVLALTGLRIDELCALQPENLVQETRGIRVIRTKAPAGVRTVYVAEQLWPWVMAAVPVPVTHRYLREHWSAAVDRAGFRKVNLAALRQLRSGLLAEASVECDLVVANPEESLTVEAVRDRRPQQESRLLFGALSGSRAHWGRRSPTASAKSPGLTG